jgi:uncharacterized protein
LRNAFCTIMETNNPFLTQGYVSKEYFCDREAETKKLRITLENGRNVTLISLRRMGKTGLIHHTFHEIKADCIYVDILHTTNLKEFTTLFSRSVLNQFESPVGKSWNQVTSIFRKIQPSSKLDPLSGQPSFDLTIGTEKEAESTLEDIFNYLKRRKKKAIIAIDEFQQISFYPEKKTEALLRSYIQNLHNVQFIFSGSSKHILTAMFSHASRPFYQSTQFLFLENLKREVYADFILKHFTKAKKKIDSNSIEEILDWSRLHTFYVQLFCHKVFLRTEKSVSRQLLAEVKEEIFEENEPYFISYKNLLSEQQWNLLKAIAKEGEVFKINQKTFLNTYHLSASTVQRSIKALEEREMVVNERNSYRVYDVFFGRWLAEKY